MADNVTLPGTGGIIASDEVGGAQYQRVKLALGADGAAADLAPGQGLMAASVPVAIASNQSAIPVTDNSTTLSIDDGGGTITVDGTVAITAAALPLPSGAATSALQGGGLPAALGAGGGLKIDGSGTALPVSGTFYQATQPVKGSAFTITVTLTVTNGAYSIADVVGGLITFSNACSAAGKAAIINTVVLSGVVAIAYELWLFASDITTPAADNAAFTLVAADAAQCKGVIPISMADYCAAQSAFNVATVRGVGLQYSCIATTLYAYLKATAVTSPGTTTLTLTIKGEFID